MQKSWGDLAEQYRAALLDDVIPYWARVDKVMGVFLEAGAGASE